MSPEFKKCVDAAGGTQCQLGAALNISAQAVGRWKKGRIPINRVIQIEKTLGVDRAILRPDVFGAANDAR